MFNYRISNLPSQAKVFVALFTTLMLLACIWAAALYYLERGQVEDYSPPVVETQPDGFQENVGLAYTSITSQTLLFFAMGLLFLFTSVAPERKKATLWVFANAVVVNTVGLTGKGIHWFFDDLLAISTVVVLAVIVYMAFLVFVDLVKKRPVREAE